MAANSIKLLCPRGTQTCALAVANIAHAVYTCPVVIPDYLTKFDDNLIIVGEMLENVAKFPMSQSKRLKFKIYTCMIAALIHYF